MKNRFVDKLINRLDRLDAGSLQDQFVRLARERGLLETILQAVQEGILVLDGEGHITYANRGAEKLLGFTLENAAGTPVSRYLRDMDWARMANLDEAAWSQLASREMETTYPEHRFIAFYVVPMSMVTPGERGAVLILRDVTRERLSVAQSLESERLQTITLLTAGVAHEIGNPLNSLTIHLQLLARELNQAPGAADPRLRELLDVATEEVARLDHIIKRFLQALRPGKPALRSTQLDSLLNETLAFLAPELQRRRVQIEVAVAQDLPVALVDAGQMRQVFHNLVKNAAQAMPHGGRLAIRLAATDRFVTLAFADSGPGIPADQLSRIFEPYYTTKAEGSGLGLVVVQRIVRDHGGQIDVHSRPGRGTEIIVYIPREDQRIRLLKAHAGDPGAPRAAGEAP